MIGFENKKRNRHRNLKFQSRIRESELLNGLSRQQLIAPIVRKLKQQARSGDRVQVVTVTGAVQLPGEYPLIGNGNIESVVAIAAVTDDAYLKNAEVRRISLGANQQANVDFFNLDLSAKEASAFRLQGRDALRINKIPSWSTEDTVQLEGEFHFLEHISFRKEKVYGILSIERWLHR